ncbi:MAG: hypothetical protein AB1705_25375 [Verrucomicrobiota bacterium]
MGDNQAAAASKRRPSFLKWVILIGPILGVLIIIGGPLIQRQRAAAQKQSCIANLKQIEGAIHSWHLENKKSQTDTVDFEEVSKHLRGGVPPVCPAGGTYTVTTVSERPRCSIPGHTL